MLMRSLVVSATLLVAAASAVQAQGKDQPDQQCRTALLELRDACQKSVDLFNLMMPQLSTAMAGGNATLGQASTLGGLGHFSLGVRATAVMNGTIPTFDSASTEPSTTGAVSSQYVTEKVPVPMPAVDLAIGLFKGIPLGVTNLGGLDLLLSAAYVPEVGDENDEVRLTLPDGSLKIGYGARLGILQEGKVRPGLSVTYLMRGLPAISVTSSDGDDPATADSTYLRRLEIDTKSWRVVASKKLMFIGLAVGYGMDSYSASSEISAVVKESCPLAPGGVCRFAPDNKPNSTEPGALVTFDQDVTRTNMFANLSLNLIIIKLVGEVGQVSGGSIKTFNTYVDDDGEADKPDKARQYASVGFRIGF